MEYFRMSHEGYYFPVISQGITKTKRIKKTTEKYKHEKNNYHNFSYQHFSF